jgi:hypothetical protein
MRLMMTKPNYFRILTALTVTAAAAVLAALLVASAPASAQESGSFVMPGSAQPGDQSTRVSRDTYVSVELVEAMDPTSINTDTFTLVKQGTTTTTPVKATVTYGEGYYIGEGGFPIYQYGAVLYPEADLEANATYTATLKGGDIGVKDIYGRSMPKDHSWYFSTGDSITPPPETTINSGPSGPVTSNSASFAFSSSESGSTFQCRLVDSTSDSDWSACSSPKAYTGLSAGSHTFHVKAIGPAGNPDTTPASRTWTVDKTAPTGTVSINNGADRTKTQSVTLTLSATDPSPGSGVSQMRISNTQSGLSSASWEPYSNTRTWTLTSGKGTKTVYVQYRDGAGNLSAMVTDTITYR